MPDHLERARPRDMPIGVSDLVRRQQAHGVADRRRSRLGREIGAEHDAVHLLGGRVRIASSVPARIDLRMSVTVDFERGIDALDRDRRAGRRPSAAPCRWTRGRRADDARDACSFATSAGIVADAVAQLEDVDVRRGADDRSRSSPCRPVISASAMSSAITPTMTPSTEMKEMSEMNACLRLASR